MITPVGRALRPLVLALLPALLFALAACDGGAPVQELNRGLPSIITLTTDTSAFAQVSPQESLPVAVRVTDPYGDAVGGVTVAWRPAGGNGGSVAPDTTLTDSDGRTATTWALGQAAGVYLLSVSAPASGAVITVSAQVR